MVACWGVISLPLLLVLVAVQCQGDRSPSVVELGEVSTASVHQPTQHRGAVELARQQRFQEQELKLQRQRREYFKLQPLAEKSYLVEKRHEAQRKRTLRHVEDAVAQVDEIVASTISSENPSKSKEAATEQKEEDATETKLAQEVNKAEELATMGHALEEEEDSGCVGLIGSQRDDSVYGSLDASVCNALEKTTPESVAAAEKALKLAQHHFRVQRLQKEADLKASTEKALQQYRQKLHSERLVKDVQGETELNERLHKHETRNATETKDKQLQSAKLKARERAGKEEEAQLLLQERAIANTHFTASIADVMDGEKVQLDYSLNREVVPGDLTPENMRLACSPHDKVPVCDSYEAFDGSCQPLDDGDALWHLSNDNDFEVHTKNHLDKVSFPERVFFYAAGVKAEDGSPKWGVESGTGISAKPGSNVNNTLQTYCTKRLERSSEIFAFKGVQAVSLHLKGQITTFAIERACQKFGNGMRPLCNSYKVLGGRCLWPAGAYKQGQELANPNSDAQRQNKQEFRWNAFFGASYPMPSNGLSAPILNYGIGYRQVRFTDQNAKVMCGRRSSQWLKKHSEIHFSGRRIVRTAVLGVMSSASIWETCKAKNMLPVCDQFSVFDGKCALLSSKIRFSDPTSTTQAGLNQESLAGTYFYTGFSGGGMDTCSLHGGEFTLGDARDALHGETWCVINRGFTFTWRGYEFATIKVPKIMSNRALLATCNAHGDGWKPVCSDLKFYKNEPSAALCQPFDVGMVRSSSRKTVMQTFPTNGQQFLDKVRGSFVYNQLSTASTLQPLGLITDNEQGELSKSRTRYYDAYGLCLTRSADWMSKQAKFKVGRHHVERVALPNNIADSKTIYNLCKEHSMLPVCGSKVWDGMCIQLDVFPSNSTHDPSTQNANWINMLGLISQNTTSANTIVGDWESRVMGTSLYMGSVEKWNVSAKDSLYVSPDGTNFLHRFGFETLCASEPPFRDPMEFNGFMVVPTKVHGEMTNKRILDTCKTNPLRRPACAHKSSFRETPTGAFEFELSSSSGFCQNSVCKSGMCDYPAGDASHSDCKKACLNDTKCAFYSLKKDDTSGNVDCQHFPNCHAGMVNNDFYHTFEKLEETDPSCFILDPGIDASGNQLPPSQELGFDENGTATPIRFSKPNQMRPLVKSGKIFSSFNYFLFSGDDRGPVFNAGTDGYFASGQHDRWTWCAEKITRSPTPAPTGSPTPAPTYAAEIRPLQFQTQCKTATNIRILGYNQTIGTKLRNPLRDLNFTCRGKYGYIGKDRQLELGEVDYDLLHDVRPELVEYDSLGHSGSRKLQGSGSPPPPPPPPPPVPYVPPPTSPPTPPPTLEPTPSPTFFSCSLEKCKDFCMQDSSCKYMGYVNQTGKCYSFESVDSCKFKDVSDKSDIYVKIPSPVEPTYKWNKQGPMKCDEDKSKGIQTFDNVKTFNACAFKCGLKPEVTRDWGTGAVLSVAPECNYLDYDDSNKVCKLYEKCGKIVKLPGETTTLYAKQLFKEPTKDKDP